MNFAFLVHARTYRDVQKKYKMVKYFPKSWVRFWCLHWPPVIVSEINDFPNITGWIIGIPMTARQMIKNYKLAQKKIIKAIDKAEKLGAKIIGLGALTSSVTNGGLDLVKKTESKLTTGNALTIAVCFQHIKEMLDKNNGIQKIAMVGGTGSIGSTLSELLVKKFPTKEYLIFARTKKNLESLIKRLKEVSNNTNIDSCLSGLGPVKQADLVIVSTSAREVIIKPEHLKQNAVVYDITQPQNVDREAIKKRPDVTLREGGLVHAPQLKTKLHIGLPAHVLFGCLAETILLALENYQGNFSLGRNIEIDKVEYINKLAQKYNFKPT